MISDYIHCNKLKLKDALAMKNKLVWFFTKKIHPKSILRRKSDLQQAITLERLK